MRVYSGIRNIFTLRGVVSMLPSTETKSFWLSLQFIDVLLPCTICSMVFVYGFLIIKSPLTFCTVKVYIVRMVVQANPIFKEATTMRTFHIYSGNQNDQ